MCYYTAKTERGKDPNATTLVGEDHPLFPLAQIYYCKCSTGGCPLAAADSMVEGGGIISAPLDEFPMVPSVVFDASQYGWYALDSHAFSLFLLGGDAGQIIAQKVDGRIIFPWA